MLTITADSTGRGRDREVYGSKVTLEWLHFGHVTCDRSSPCRPPVHQYKAEGKSKSNAHAWNERRAHRNGSTDKAAS